MYKFQNNIIMINNCPKAYLKALGVILLFFTHDVKAQLFLTKSELVASFGFGYIEGVSPNGGEYFQYSVRRTTSTSGTYTRITRYFFMRLDNGDEICYLFQVFEPRTEGPTLIRYCNSRYTLVGDLRWKDYTNNFVYDISFVNNLSIFQCFYEK
jgi:hypothetical protein